MRTLIRLVVLILLGSSSFAQAPKPVADTEARTPEAERMGFHLPEGFAIELVASEPMIGKPMNLAFDARGRLWVSSTVEYPFPAGEGKTPRDRVIILSDFAPDGHARKGETFAEGLNIPIGLLPIGRGDSALIHAIPSIRRYTDTDGDGKADRSELAYEKYGSADTHGMTNAFTRGFDGWIYACHGFANNSSVAGSDGAKVVMQSGNVYRFKLDGSRAEYFSHGQVNPFGLTLDPMGRLYSCDSHSRPIYQNLRGAYYPSFGKPDDGLGFGPEMTGDDHGSTGIGGVAYYAADHFPQPYRDSAFIGNVVTGRVHHDSIRWQGSSPRAERQPDLITSDDPWFHPVDLEVGPDGALYIADFYNRIIGHYEVPLDHPGRDRERGRIWRVVYRGKDGTNPPPVDARPQAPEASVLDLIADLNHPNLVVRTRSAELLVLKGRPSVEAPLIAALEHPQGWQTVHALWVLHRLGALDDARLALAAKSPDEAVRVHAARIYGDRGLESGGFAVVAAGLRDPSPNVRRASAEALGAHPTFAAIRPLLDLLASTPWDDDHLRHVARISLREPLRDESAWEKISLSTQDETALADVALGIPSPGSARYLLGYLTRHPDRPDRRDRMVRLVARYGEGDPRSALLTFARSNGFASGEQVAVLKAIAGGTQERGKPVGPEVLAFAGAVAVGWLGSTDPQLVQSGVDLAASMKLTGVAEGLANVMTNRNWRTSTRTSAMAAWTEIDPDRAVVTLSGRLGDGTEPLEVRDQAAKLLGASGRGEARTSLIAAMSLVPARIQTTIAAALASTRPGAEALLDAVAGGKASSRPLGDRSVMVKLQASGLPDLQARLTVLLKDSPLADQRILATIDDRRANFLKASGGDPTAGASVFARNCANCHQIGGQGGRVGPQLDGIGIRGLDRLLEDVLDPNRNVDQAFRVTNLALKDGRVVSGLLLRQDGEVLVLGDVEGKEVRVSEASIEDRKIAPMSPMPANWGDAIDPTDFRHLMAYLLSKGALAGNGSGNR